MTSTSQIKESPGQQERVLHYQEEGWLFQVCLVFLLELLALYHTVHCESPTIKPCIWVPSMLLHLEKKSRRAML